MNQSTLRHPPAPTRVIAIVFIALLLVLQPVWALAARANPPAISGVVKDTGDVEQPGVLVEVLSGGSSTVAATTTTGDRGTFSVDVPSGTYDVRFTPPADAGLRSYLATGVNADSGTPLTVVLKSMHVATVQGVVRDRKGNLLRGWSVYISPTDPSGSTGSTTTDQNGHYSLEVLAGAYRFGLSCAGCGGLDGYHQMDFTATVDIDNDTTHDLTVPYSTLTIAIRDADGTPITGARISTNWQNANTADYNASNYSGGTTNSTGDMNVQFINGTPQQTTTLYLPNGLTIPITLPAINGDRRLFFIFDRTTGALYLDDQPPAVFGTPDRDATNGWYNGPVTITWKSVDPRPSSGTPTRPPVSTMSTEGANQVVTSQPSCDPADNCATGTYTVSIDKTAPTIVASLSKPANSQGWHNEPVTVSFTCQDALSGVANCPGPVTIADDGADQDVTGTAIDDAGNTATTTVHIKLDRTAPTVTASVSQAPNAAGWNNGDVTVTFTCSDAGSGIASCPDAVTLTEDGADQKVSGTGVDRAGNSTTTTTVTVSIDKTKPLIVATRTAANNHGWNNSDVTINYTCSDADSGIANCPDPATLTQEGSGQSTSGTTTNHAGLSSTALVEGINIDRTPPAITATVIGTKNAAGWYQTPPTVHFTCTDALAGTDVCPADITVTGEGANLTVTGTAVDKAGNSATTTVTDLDVDYTAPTVTITGAANGATYPLDQIPSPACATTDNGSGVAANATLSIDRSSAGQYTATCTGARDNAGNSTPPVTINYTVAPTADSLIGLTAAYLPPDANGVLTDLTNKLQHGQICQYILKVNKETGGGTPTLTTQEAAELTYWARILNPTC